LPLQPPQCSQPVRSSRPQPLLAVASNALAPTLARTPAPAKARTIVQIHLSGHEHNETHIVDTHDASMIEAVWLLYG
jgi:hypothetical protein